MRICSLVNSQVESVRLNKYEIPPLLRQCVGLSPPNAASNLTLDKGNQPLCRWLITKAVCYAFHSHDLFGKSQ
jgi:hypothetical protein